jgi:hypothetical protein
MQMHFPYRTAGMLTLLALGACGQEQQHPIDRQLSQLRPEAVVPLVGLGWPAGTLVCPMTPYQSTLPDKTPVAKRVNDFLRRRQFVGDEDHWSLVVIKPATTGDDGIEHRIFKRDSYDVVTDGHHVENAAVRLRGSFRQQDCVPVERARVLVTRIRSDRNLIMFGTS